MEDWVSALKSASSTSFNYPPGSSPAFSPPDADSSARRNDDFEAGPPDILCNHHHWYATSSHIRPTYCSVCRDATSHGLACEVCKCKVHKRCAAKSLANCKWTTLASVGKDILEDQDGNILMPHQWHEGNLPVASTCAVCKKTCGSVLRYVLIITQPFQNDDSNWNLSVIPADYRTGDAFGVELRSIQHVDPPCQSSVPSDRRMFPLYHRRRFIPSD